MNLSRREFLQMLSTASLAGFFMPVQSLRAATKLPSNLYEIPKYGNVSFMHFTDSHAQLLPAYYREPDIHIGVAEMSGKVPHLVGRYLLEKYKIKPKSPEAYALTFLDFKELAHQYGAMGGFAHMATMINRLRADRPGALLLDGGDTWQGSATSIWTNGQDMIDAQKLMGVDVMTGHWEFTYGMERVKEVVKKDFAGKIDFVAQNVVDKELEDPIFKPYVIREVNGIPVAIIGQAFPYTPIANPAHFTRDWQFGLREAGMQAAVDTARGEGAKIVVMLSHNGMDVDIKMASRVTGVDVILGGHTHDAVPEAIPVSNPGGKTLVINSGAAGKFVSLLDLDVTQDGKIRGYQYKLVPVFSNLIEPDAVMKKHIEDVRKPYLGKLQEKLAITNDTLYRRDTFNGTFDQVIMDAMIETQDAQIAFSPGFRWGMTVLPGEAITFEDVMSQTAITYPQVTRSEITGNMIKLILEDVADNRFNSDPYAQQGGDMARVGGMTYTIDINKPQGERIQQMMLKDEPIDLNKKYVVAGWASVNEDVEGPAIWDVVAEYLRNKKTVSMKEINVPRIKGASVKTDPGIQSSRAKN